MPIAGLVLALTVGVAAAAPEQPTPVQQVLELTNAERQGFGLPSLVLSQELQDAAQNYSEVLSSGDCFAHTCGPVPSVGLRVELAGYTVAEALAENIAAGQPSPESVVAAWMASPSHRANILSDQFGEIGIGLVAAGDEGGTYWVQEFGKRAIGQST